MSLFLGIEIGGTKLQLVLGSHESSTSQLHGKDQSLLTSATTQWRVAERLRFAVSKEEGAVGIRRHIEQSIQSIVQKNKITAIGVGFGGPVDWQTGTICCSHQIEGWSEFPIAEWLASMTDAPVFVDNDANVAAFGEALQGAGVGYDPLFYVTMGSGVGGGLVSNGIIYHGAKPGESEIGHVRLDKTGRIVEESCSGWAVDRKIRKMILENPNSSLARLIGVSQGNEAGFLKSALEANDSIAQEILDETAEDLAFGLSHVVHLFHPEIIVLGGGLSLVGEPLRAAVTHHLDRFVMRAFSPRPIIALAKLGEDAVPIGALECARIHH
ncbi:MAG: ROK family protein [Verrucomicrobia bacterium]|nr:ROK family protein [Verrucomicrobiota bacterium]